MIGKTISHYRILEKLGEGGMGVVYKAEDTKLKRHVAIKFLPRQIAASEEERQRFKIEAQAAAALNHPNIATIHNIEDVDNETFIVMEYIEGKELKKIIDNNLLSIDDALNCATQIAEGLRAAHEKGITHRDIKSSNIIVTESDQVKIMDFGLAKVAGAGMHLTKSGTTLGTVSYMSPEQARGEEINHRTDIWSFGVVLYEMLTSEMPFKGDYEQAITYSILNEEQQPITGLRTGIPMEMERIVNKCLQKDPSDRYQHTDEFIVDLRQIKKESETRKLLSKTGMSRSLSQKQKRLFVVPSIIAFVILLLIAGYFFFSGEAESNERIPIAVADFVNLTKEPELDGLSGMLITALEQSRRLAVVTRSRMFDILDQMGKKDVTRIDESLSRQICQQANISAMVVASIRKFGKLYTIDLKVVDSNKNEYLFTAKEEAEGQESIPSMLDKLSKRTRIGLKERVTQVKETSQNVTSVTTSNLEAYQHFFQGEQLINQLKFEEAIEEFKKALARDSIFTQAYYRLAYAESWAGGSEEIPKNHLERAFKHINRMPEKERYLVRAQYRIVGDNYKAGIDILKEMEKIYPDDKEMIYNIGDWSYHINNYTTAVAYLNKTLQIDPNHQRALQHLTWTYRDMENYDNMLETAKRYVSVSGSVEPYLLLVDAFTQLGQFEHGIKYLQQAQDLFPDNYRITRIIADLYAYHGEYAKAEEELKKLIEKNRPSEIKRYGYAALAFFYPYQGKYRQALSSIDKAIQLSWQSKDTSRAGLGQALKAFTLLSGWNDPDKAWIEFEKTSPFRNKITGNPYWGYLNLIQLYQGDYVKAISLADSLMPKPWYQSVQSIMFSLKRDEKNAKIFADSVLQRATETAKIAVLYPLAECQYEKGQLNKALESVKKLQAINVRSRSFYYPKSFYLMGKIHEKKGDTNFAIKNYEKLLELWKDADEDLPDLIDAKERLAKLSAISSN
ncbi:protein kinase [candidate division KSB1 bacterium]|nr:protein kinase [candidate division KSB1 bacterium]